MFAQPHTATSLHNAAYDSIICKGLQRELTDHLFEISSVQHVGAKEAVFWEGDPSDHVYEVLGGVVMLSKFTPDGRRQVMGFVHPGQLFGLGASEGYAYTAEAVISAKVCRYPRRRLEQSMSANPSLGHRLLAWASSELAMAQEQMLLLGRKTAIEKVASFLLRLSKRNEEHGEGPLRLFLPMTRNDLGDYLGLTTETVSRSITRLKQLGIIELPSPNHVTVRNLDRLMDVSEDESCCS